MRMKFRIRLILFIWLGIPLLVVGSCATPSEASTEARIYSPQTDEELFGTWTNPEYDGVHIAQKFINYPWGLTEGYTRIDSKSPSYLGTYFIADKRSDSAGSIRYKVVWQWRNNPTVYRYYLVRLAVEQGIWEQAWSYDGFPSEAQLSPENEDFYRVYYRE